jgi:hypothetical protein
VLPGEEYAKAVVGAIEASRALVVVLSEHANQSPFVGKEVERAVSKRKLIVPVRICEVVPSGALELFISASHWIDAWETPIERHLPPLVDALADTRRETEGPRTQFSSEPVRRRRAPVVALGVVLMVSTMAAIAVVVVSAPWQPTWKRDPAAFLVGSWCGVSESGFELGWDFVRLGPSELEVTPTHTSVGPSRKRVLATDSGIELTMDASESGSHVVRYRVVDARTMTIASVEGKAVDGPTLVRCQRKGG